MCLLARGLPRTVEVCGEAVEVDVRWRRWALAFCEPDRGAAGRVRLLRLAYGPFDEMPEAVLLHAPEALEAARGFLSGGFEACSYGAAARDGAGRLFDLDQDGWAIAADFQRLYGVDLHDPGERMHWWRFCALLMGCVRTEGSLMAQAVSARGRVPEGLKGRDRQREAARRRSWALEPTEAELRERAAREFGGW